MINFLFVLCALFFTSTASFAGPNTNVTVIAAENDLFSASERVEKDEFGIAIDDRTKVGFNEDGDPAVFSRF